MKSLFKFIWAVIVNCIVFILLIKAVKILVDIIIYIWNF